MDIRSVKLTDQGALVVWRSTDEHGKEIEHIPQDADYPSPEFRAALEALVAPTVKALEIGGKWGDTATFRSLSISQKGKADVLTVTLNRKIDVANGPVNLSTPALAFGEGEDGTRKLPKYLDEPVVEALRLAARFAAGQEREQRDLFEEEAA